jgi:hypothetical protein
MWWLIAVGIILIGIWVYGTFFMKKKTEDKSKPLEGVSEGVKIREGLFRRSRIDRERDIQEADNRLNEAGLKSIQTATAITQAEIEQEELEAAARRKKEQEEAAHLKELARLEAERIAHEEAKLASEIRIQLTHLAIKAGQDLGTYQEIQRKTELDRLELTKQWETAQQKLKAGFIYQLQAQQHLSLLTEYIGSLYDRAKTLKKERKYRELELIEEHIAFMEGDFRGRQRLLQAGENNDGDDAVVFGELEEPDKKKAGRPKGSKNKPKR